LEKGIFVQKRYQGPPKSANGGYVCGLIANQVNFTPTITLHAPPPLDSSMKLHLGSEIGELKHIDKKLAEIKPGELDFEAPDPPVFSAAELMSENYTGFNKHPFPSCFVCGPERKPFDGLRIFPGKADGHDLVAAPWRPYLDLGDERGRIKNEFIWAALDCPGAFAAIHDMVPIMLGRMTAEIRYQPKVNEKCIVIGWSKGNKGRKHFTGTAVFSESKGLCAVADSVWITI
jgi:hypothetical protein